MDLMARTMALKARNMNAKDFRTAVEKYIADHPEAVDEAAIEALFGDRLGGIEEDVGGLQNAVSAIDGEIYFDEHRDATTVANGWRLNESNGLCSSNAEYQLKKYSVKFGETLKIISDDRFQFQTVASVPSSGANNRVGATCGSGTFVLTVPATATYLVVSTPINGSSDVFTVQSSISNLKTSVAGLESDVENIISTRLDVSDWELGFRYVNNGADAFYSGGNERVSTKRGTYIHLKKGDCIVNLKNAQYDVRGGYSEDGVTWTAFEMLTQNYYVAPVAGRYFLRVDDITKGVLTSADIASVNANIFIANECGTSSIDSLNPDFDNKIAEAKRGKNITTDGYQEAAKPLTLLHFSDIHGDEMELARAVELMRKKAAFIDDAICTGDMITERWSDGMAFWNHVAGAEKILLAIGNHDVMTASTGYDDEQRASAAEQHARYIAPYYENWHITSSVTGNLTYYYKDYPDSKIRLIVLNDMLQSADMETQKAWLAASLSDAITSEYSVVVARHCQTPSSEAVDCGFTNMDRFGLHSYADYSAEVDAFIGNGGSFLCYLCGHLHWDQISVYRGTNGNQLSVSVECLNINQGNMFSDTQRICGFRSQDVFNAVTFDTSSNVIKIIRVGANMDHYLRPKNVLAIRPDGTIVSEA